jgi:hypothetical protein
MTPLSLLEIFTIYLIAAILYLSYLWDKRHGPYEWERKMESLGTGLYKNRKYCMLVLAILIFIMNTIFTIEWLIYFLAEM